ncbi:MAG: ABC-2 family transporter protein [Lachnospiraceae bacterium]
MYLKKFTRIIKVLLGFEVRRYQYFVTDTLLGVMSKIFYLLINLFFWWMVMDTGYNIQGWSYGDILVFIAFSELFYGMDNAIFSIISRFWRVIHSGSLDIHLTRPMDPRMRLILINIDYMGLLTTIITFVFLLMVSGKSFQVVSILGGILIVLVANVILAFIRITLSYIAFWHGKMDAVTEIADSLSSFNKYPLVIMPKIAVVVMKFVVPFYFFSTFSAELVIHHLDIQSFIIGIVGIGCNLIIWYGISTFVWKRGLKRYESISG